MPITLITALPGGGKSTYLVDRIEKRRIEEDRPVYYFNIEGLKLPWTQMESPELWHEVPANSIVVIDECQDVFPVLKQGATKPDHYQLLSKHRKMGLDLILVTQHPNFVDAYVRKVVQHHVHLKRVAGFEKSMMYTSINGVMDVDRGLKKASKSIYKFPPETFALHKSAAAHTIKKKFPVRVLIFPILVIVGVVLGYNIYSSFTGDGDPVADIPTLNNTPPSPSQSDNSQPLHPIPRRKINVITHGVFDRLPIFLVGEFQDQQFFKVDGMLFPKSHLVKLGYEFTRIDDCLLKLGNTIITCPPEIDLQVQEPQILVNQSQESGERDLSRAAPDAQYFNPALKTRDSTDTPVSAFHSGLNSQSLSISQISWTDTQ